MTVNYLKAQFHADLCLWSLHTCQWIAYFPSTPCCFMFT